MTLEPGVSSNQTDEMQAKNLQLVVPSELQKSYSPAQQKWLIDLSSFIELVRSRTQ
jgi:EcoRII C terminal